MFMPFRISQYTPSIETKGQALPELPKGFAWSGKSAIYEFEIDGKSLKFRVPIDNPKNASKILAPFNEEKIRFLGKVSLAAGLGTDATKLSFKRNENGECTTIQKHKQNGKIDKLNDKYFTARKTEIIKNNLGLVKEKSELKKVRVLEGYVKDVKRVFNASSFKGIEEKQKENPSAPVVKKEEPKAPRKESEALPAPVMPKSMEDNRISKLKESILQETKPKELHIEPKKEPVAAAQAEAPVAAKQPQIPTLVDVKRSYDVKVKAENFMKNELAKYAGIDLETKLRIADFVENSPEGNISEFMDRLAIETDKYSFPKRNINILEKDIEILKKFQLVLKHSQRLFEKRFKDHYETQDITGWNKFKSKNKNKEVTIFDYDAYRKELV